MFKKIGKVCLVLIITMSFALGILTSVKAMSEKEQIETIQERLKEYFLTLDTFDDGAKVETCYVSEAEKYLAMMKDDGSFDDVNYTSTQNAANGGAWDPYLALDRLQAIAIAYHKEGNTLYHKEEVVEKLNQAIIHWNNIDSGLSTTLKGPRSTNWWENQVGVQLRFSRIALFMDGIMSDEAMNIMLTKLKEKTPEKYGTGQNNLWFDQNYVYHAIITEDGDELKDMVTDYLNYCLLTQLDDNTAEAVQVDNSFYMHGKQFYSNGYGLSMFRDMSFWIYILRDTDFSLSQDVMDRMADYMINGTSWTIRGDIMELYLGYRPYSYDIGYENYAYAYIDPLKRMIASDEKNASQYQKILDNILDPNQSNGKDGNYYMWRSAYASHMRDGYGVNIKMDSQDIIGGEWRGSWSGTNYGQLIYWTSSAASTITVDGDEYTNVFPVYDWAHCPGTTTPARIVQDFSNSGRFTNGTDHTIGVSNGQYGSTAYVMSKKDTQATKGYFFFDNEFVALGAGITSKETTNVHTTLNQCEADHVIVDGQSVDLNTNNTYDANYIYNDKVGYVFLEETAVHVSNVKYDQIDASLWDEDKQKESSPVFMAYLDHGSTPTNASYAYIVVPDTTADKVSSYADNIPVSVVANTADVQAVRHDGLKQTQINFYKAGSLEYKSGYTVSVDQPCSLIIDESGDTRKISVAVNDKEAHQTVNVTLSYNDMTTNTTFVSQALPYAGQTITLEEGLDNRYQASSSSENHPITNIVDGNVDTYWESDGNKEQAITLFTGTDQYIKSMNIQWGDHPANEYDVYISQDGISYDLIQSINDGSEEVSIGAICHYVKIVMKSGSYDNYQIREVTFELSQLLSQGKETQTSSVSTNAPTFTGNLAVDGDFNTRWASLRNSDDNWITVDLGKKAILDAVEINWEAACSDNYQIEVSDDNETWTTVKANLVTDTSLTDKIIFDETVEGRYVKLHSLQSRKVSNINYGINVYEFKVYGEYKRAEENIALGKSTETSSQSTQAPTLTGDLTVDGNKAKESRWASLRNSDDNWITIDLGKQAAIDDIIVYWEASCSDNYQIEVSDDNENWTIVQSNLVSDAGLTDKISFAESINARYVKIHSLKSRSFKYGINVIEIEIYGTYFEEDVIEENIALNKPATASSVYQNYGADRAFDGSAAGSGADQSRWVSLRRKENPNTNVDEEWIYVDLEDYYNISKVVLNWEGACGKEYKIQVSTDGTTWTDISHITDGKDGIKTLTYDEDIIARYVKMQGIEPVGEYGYSLWEFEVYGELTELPEDNIALNKPSYASSEYIDPKDGNKEYDSSLAFDGSDAKIDGKDSRWVSNRNSNDEWIYVDLEDYYNISKVVLNWEGACGKEYKIQVSTDGITWTDISHVTDGKEGIKTLTYDEDVIARYVKMQGIEPIGVYGYSLWEFEVYGDLVEKDVLKTIYDQYSQLDTSNYTPASITYLKNALNEVLNVYNQDEVSREEIIAVIQKLDIAVSQLTEKADKTALKELIDKANSIDENLYTPNSMQMLNAVLLEVEKVYLDDDASQTEVQISINQLQIALDSLIEKADKEELKKLIDHIENIDEALYKPSSITALKEVLNDVESVYNDENASEEDIEQAIEKLTQAYQQLSLKADNTQLKNLVASVENLDKSLYTTDSFKILEVTVQEANEVIENGEATDESIAEMIKKVENAIQGLVQLNRSALKDLLTEVEQINQAKYTEDSLKALNEAIEKAKQALETTSQDEIDNAYKELLSAKNSLEEIELPEQEKPDDSHQETTDYQTSNSQTETKDSEKNSVKTGDDTSITLMIINVFISLIGLNVLRKKYKY